MELNIDDEIILDIKRLGINGEGIGFYKKLAVFVDGAIPGEAAKVKIISLSDKMAKAEIIEIIKKSDARVEPICKHYNECGGCQTMHIAYNAMGAYKRDMIVEAINRYTNLNPRSFEIKQTVVMDSPYNYRNKSSLPVRDFNGDAVVGIINPDTNKVVYIDDCYVQHKLVNEVNNEALKIINELGISTYHEFFKRGVIKFIVCRVSTKTNEVQVTIICNEKNPKIFTLAEKLIKHPNVVSVYEDFNDSKKQGSIFGNDLKLLQGKPAITEEIGGYKFDLKPNAFFQLNPVQTEKMYETIKRLCKLSRNEVVLDGFCGVGTISIYLAKMAKKVIGIEYTKESVENAKYNAIQNKIKNAEFYQGDVNEVLTQKLEETVFDVMVFDPPRTGLQAELLETIMNSNTKRIVYVSCNPATLAKDLAVLSEKYNVKQIVPFDMFPMTSHCECVALLERK